MIVTHLNRVTLDDDRREQLMRAFYCLRAGQFERNRARQSKAVSTAIQNPIVKAITETIYRKYEADFYLYPAATKFHHAYISGLAYHTVSMLKLADGFLTVYPFLNKRFGHRRHLLARHWQRSKNSTPTKAANTR
ncbi:MAG: hypothetical protein MZU97_24070 [Bacillus subtilis]|nr:hypothetical protein [Bacillus subtilis]